MSRSVTMLHFNDCYNIEGAKQEPVGGAARLVTKVKSMASEEPLVLFSGDVYNPSLLSTITKGKQMPAVLNAAQVAVSCIGNHDLDYGIENYTTLCGECNFPFLCTNATDVETGEPLGGSKTHVVIDHCGVRIGFMGLIEPEWLGSIATVDASQVQYTDYLEAGRRYAQILKSEGAEVVVALTHMRWPEDEKVASDLPEIDIVLGGHDHDAGRKQVGERGTWIIKSGTDFRQMTKLRMTLEPGARPTWEWEDVLIDSSVTPDPEIQAHVDEALGCMQSKMGMVIGEAGCDLDGRFATVRLKESNLGNLIADVLRVASKADVVILNSGTFRSDRVHAAGPVLLEDLFAILPMIDGTVVVSASGGQLLGALENGVSRWPALEGRFPQVSGICFSFDPSKPPGQRVVPGSCQVQGQALEEGKQYSLATKEFMVEGKDGYDCLQDTKVLMDSDCSPVLPTALRNFFTTLDVLNMMQEKRARLLHWKHHTDRMLQRQFSDQDRGSGLAVKSRANGLFVVKPRVEGRIVCVGGGDE